MKAPAVLVICAVFVSGQQPAVPAPDSQRPGTVFTVTSTLVQLDAVVTDSKGRHVTDLGPEDFEVLEDGKPQKLTHFSYVRIKTEPAAPAEPPATIPKPTPKSVASLPPPPMAQLRPEDVRRTIVLMVDDLGLSFESMAYVRTSLHKFVERQMQPGDLVAICRTGAGSGALQQFSADKRVLLAIVDGLRWNANGRFGANYFEAYGRLSALAAALSGTGHGAATRSGDSRSLDVSYDARENAVSTVGTLGAINYIVGALRELPGRKSIVLFSDGFSLYEASGTTARYDDVQRALRELIDRANRSGTVIYTMHAAGLQTVQPDASDRVTLDGVGTTGISAEQRDRILNSRTQVGARGGRDVELNMQQQNLGYLADKTGGLAYENGNDLNWGLERVMEDQQGYYLLGYHPPEGTLERKNRQSDFHNIQVKVTRAGLHVRSRTGFFGESDAESLPKYTTPVEQLRATMLSPFQSAAVGVRLTALYAEVPKIGPVVRNLLRINAADLTWHHDARGSDFARILLVAVATGEGAQPLAAMGRVYDLQVKPGMIAEARRNGVFYSLDVPVPKRGAYQVRVAVRDEATGKIGSATQFIEVPNLKKAGFALSSVVLREREQPLALTGREDLTPAIRQFPRGTALEFLCLVARGRNPKGDLDLATRVRILRDGKEVYSAPAKLVDAKGNGQAVFGALKLTDEMPPGEYYLQVIAADQKGKGDAAGQWTDFTVLP
jgi:VWFA-related protein